MRIHLLIPTILLPLIPVQGVTQVHGLVHSAGAPRVTPDLAAEGGLVRGGVMHRSAAGVSIVLTLPSQEAGPRSPTWARFMGGFLTGTATLAGLLVATWDDPDRFDELTGYAAFAAGTAGGAMITTSIWERPRWTMALGAAIGAVPLLVATGIDDDDTASLVLMVAWIGAPFGATLGQR
jgi:hypothetical protein